MSDGYVPFWLVDVNFALPGLVKCELLRSATATVDIPRFGVTCLSHQLLDAANTDEGVRSCSVGRDTDKTAVSNGILPENA
jgi:hypothetical protein